MKVNRLSKKQESVLNSFKFNPGQQSNLIRLWNNERYISLPIWRYAHFLARIFFLPALATSIYWPQTISETNYEYFFYFFVGILICGFIEYIGHLFIILPADANDELAYREYLSYTSCRNATIGMMDCLTILAEIAIIILAWKANYFWLWLLPTCQLILFVSYKINQKRMVQAAIEKLL